MTAYRVHTQEGGHTQDPGHPAASPPNSGTLYPRVEARRDGSGCLPSAKWQGALRAACFPALRGSWALAGPPLSARSLYVQHSPYTEADTLMCVLFLSSDQTESTVPQNRRREQVSGASSLSPHSHQAPTEERSQADMGSWSPSALHLCLPRSWFPRYLREVSHRPGGASEGSAAPLASSWS